jgi:rubrerythrin
LMFFGGDQKSRPQARALPVGAATPALPQVWTCGKCYATVRATDKFCPSCAAPVNWSQPSV